MLFAILVGGKSVVKTSIRKARDAFPAVAMDEVRSRTVLPSLPEHYALYPLAKKAFTTLLSSAASDSPTATSQAHDAGRLMLSANVLPVVVSSDLPDSRKNAKTIVCFSDSGIPSIVTGAGQLRALQHLGLIEAVDQVIGGMYASIPIALYMFAQGDDQALLGELVELGRLTPSSLHEINGAISSVPASAGAADFLRAMSLLQIGGSTDVLADYVAANILADFNLSEVQAFMAKDPEHVESIKARNPALNNSIFYTPRPDRPDSFLLLATLAAPYGSSPFPADELASLQISADYTGSPFFPDHRAMNYANDSDAKSFTRLVGGGLVESFAFGGDARDKLEAGSCDPSIGAPARPLSLAQALSLSLRSPVFDVVTLNLPSYWPVSREQIVPASPYVVRPAFFLDNTGVLAALQSQPSRILLFTNNGKLLSANVSWCSSSWETEVTSQAFQDIDRFDPLPLFGFGKLADLGTWIRAHNKNQVFQKEDLFPIMCKLKAARDAGGPAVHRTTLKVLDNSWWGIKSCEVEVLFAFLDRYDNFERALPKATQESLRAPGGHFEDFPFFPAHFVTGNFLRPLEMFQDQINLLAAQTERAVVDKEDLFREFLTGQ